jgi:hypothetical protein
MNAKSRNAPVTALLLMAGRSCALAHRLCEIERV